MARLAANLTMMFGEVPLLDRFGAAAAAGFRAVEIVAPYAEPADALARAARSAGVEVVLINAPMGDPSRGEVGITALPGRAGDVAADVERALAYATALGAPRIHLLAGIVPEGVSRAACEEAFLANLAAAADRAAQAGVAIMLEPLNPRDVPGYLHARTAETRRLMELVGRPNVRLQYDLYHLQIAQGDLVEGARRDLDLIGHIQLSSVPGRHEPPYGEVDIPFVIDAIEALGYDGWFGCEYRPRAGTVEGLGWAARYGIG